MGPRPANLNLNKEHDEAFQPPRAFGLRDMPSPRTGEVPPALSPLDAFALQSRMLAQKFQQEKENGRRMSRLPPTMVAQEMANRPGYFRSISNEGPMSDVEEEESPASQRAITTIPEASPSRERPVSHYPRFSHATVQEDEAPAVPTPFYDAMESQQTSTQKEASPDYFGLGAPRAASPEQVDRGLVQVQAPSPNDYPSLTSSIDTISSHPRTMTNDSQRSHRSQISERILNLAPPQSPRYPRSPRSFQSIRSVPPDSGDEDGQSVAGSQPLSSARKFSGSSNMSRPQSPFSPWMHPVHRSPSMTSEYSMSDTRQPPRATANFSRPMSSAGSRLSFDTRPSMDTRQSFDSRSSFEHTRPVMPVRQTSGNSSSTEHSSKSALSRQVSTDDHDDFPPLEPPTQVEDPERATTPNSSSSYIYAKYKLPRAKQAERESKAFRDSWIQKQFEWDRLHDRESHHERTHSEAVTSTMHQSPALSDTDRIGRSLTPVASEVRSQSADPRASDRAANFHRSSPSVKTASTDRTIKPSPLHKKSASADLTPEEHLELGINCQLNNQDQKSTYHFRLAAIAGLPAGMLLYGLACQHGWGMRCVPEQGVMWLQKAVAAIGLDVAEADEKLGTSKLDPAERRIRKTRYACGIYQLGMSSLQGNGCPKDKIAALRYFEFAATWGDADAMEMAGNCYARGEGCKKDPKKAASLLRKAADMGQYSAGNSWIYKDKYMTEDAADTSEKEGKRPDTSYSRESRGREDRTGGSRARSRSLWGRSRKEKPPPSPALPPTS